MSSEKQKHERISELSKRCLLALARKELTPAMVNDLFEILSLGGEDSGCLTLFSYAVQRAYIRAPKMLARIKQRLRDKLQRNPDPAASSMLGYVYMVEKNFSAALAEFDAATHLSPNFAKAYSLRGELFLRQRQYTKALQDADKAIAIAPEFTAYWLRARIYNALDCGEKGLQDVTEMLAIDPLNVDGLLLKAELLELLERYDEAKSCRMKVHAIRSRAKAK